MSCIPAFARKQIASLCRDVIALDGEQDEAPSLSLMAKQAQAILDGPLREARSHSRRVAVKAAPRVKEKRLKREERNERAKEIRARVFARADGRCECCRSRSPAEWHHLISGGLRRHAEAFETTAAVCEQCHINLHRSRWAELVTMRAWAAEHGYSAAFASIDKRTAKLPTPSIPKDAPPENDR